MGTGILVGGMATMPNDIDIARSYIDAPEHLTAAEAIQDGEGWRLQYPILLLYRHALELYLKEIIAPKKLNHDLRPLIGDVDRLLREQLHTELPVDLKKELLIMAALDPGGESFRYSQTKDGKPLLLGEFEHWIPLNGLQEFMKRVFSGLESVLRELRR